MLNALLGMPHTDAALGSGLSPSPCSVGSEEEVGGCLPQVAVCATRAKVVRGMKDPILRLGGAGIDPCLLCSYCAIVTNAIFYVHHHISSDVKDSLCLSSTAYHLITSYLS